MMRSFYLRSTEGRLHGRAPGANGHTSKYLLTGLSCCGDCQGGFLVHSLVWGTGRRFAYVCTRYHRKGTTVCTNARTLPMIETNGTVLETIEAQCLTTEARARILASVLAAVEQRADSASPRRAALMAELATLETEIARYTAAVGQAPDLPSLLEALRTREARRRALRAELDVQDEA
jgi:hypothetical protein